MIIGVPKEIKKCENRVSLIPSSVKTLVEDNNIVYVQKDAGAKIGFYDEQYEEAGAKILNSAEEIYAKSEIIVKVKELQKEEFAILKQGQTVLSYAYLAICNDLLDTYLKKKITGISYEFIQMPDGRLPMLIPVSEVAGRVSIQIGARLLENTQNGTGKLLGGVPGVYPCDVLIIGAGVAGVNAAKVAVGMGANVIMLDTSPEKLNIAEKIFRGQVKTAMSNKYNIAKFLKNADLVIGSVFGYGAVAPILITEDMVKTMKKGSVIIDLSIDQGGICETMREETDLENPTFEKHGVIHFGVTNVPSCVARTAAISFNNYILPYVQKLASKGFIAAVKSAPELYKGVNTFKGKLTNPEISKYAGFPYSELSMLIGF